ncbi:unnamed protein product [Phytomonas sp. Hart1]|nr:unnamed protein product [Phytomonas sp. Hart1]|eukprot:CCW70303.1 unnamed protein product [Phytomonas sp. isolate Hart1]
MRGHYLLSLLFVVLSLLISCDFSDIPMYMIN